VPKQVFDGYQGNHIVVVASNSAGVPRLLEIGPKKVVFEGGRSHYMATGKDFS
jgi:hypothetical protein